MDRMAKSGGSNGGMVSLNKFILICALSVGAWFWLGLDQKVNSDSAPQPAPQVVQASQPISCEGSGITWVVCVLAQDAQGRGK